MQNTKSKLYAFVSTSFGFGPISKAVSVARELKVQAPNSIIHYFGAGIDYDFAQKSGVFEKIFPVDVDDKKQLTELLPTLSQYSAVFSVLNLDLPPLWKKEYGFLYLIDSLAWMWPTLPDGLTNVKTYFVQDYLIPPERLEEWGQQISLQLVAPIESASLQNFERFPITKSRKSNQLLVNFSGCYNPLTGSDFFENYVGVLTNAILEITHDQYGSIVFCCNEKLTDFIRKKIKNVRGVNVGHFEHNQFLQLLASSQRVLSTPGITTTLEAIALNIPISFLLPQNYSQVLISERYRELLGDSACMALSKFGPEFRVDLSLPESEGVRLAVSNLQVILSEYQPQIRRFIADLLTVSKEVVLKNLKGNIKNSWEETGQKSIVKYCLIQKKEEVS